MTPVVLSRALLACLGLGALDLGVLNFVVLPQVSGAAAKAPRAAAARVRSTDKPAPAPTSSSSSAPARAQPARSEEPAGGQQSAESAESVESASAPALPMEPSPRPPLITVLEFAVASRRLDSCAAAMLDEVLIKLRCASEIVVVGHADASGPDALNERVSAERAAAVAQKLANAGIARARIRVEARGEREPRSQGGNDRRVEIYAYAQDLQDPALTDGARDERASDPGSAQARSGGQR